MANIIMAVDPGNINSAYVIFDCAPYTPLVKDQCANAKMRERIEYYRNGIDTLLIEYPRPRGQPMYYQLVDTIFWVGRFVEAYGCNGPDDYWLVDRKDVKMNMVGSTKATDANLRMACINRFRIGPDSKWPLGGGKVPEVGIKSQRGPLYGFACDTWQALAIAISYVDGGLKNITPPEIEAGKQKPKAEVLEAFLC